MADSAKTVTNYEVYENDKKIGDLSDYVDGDAKWVDGTTKKAVEFKLQKGGDLLAGKTYKIKVDNNVETDDGSKLSSNQKTITFKTPSISEAQPTAKFARVSGTNELSVIFDTDLADDANFNAKQITVKKPGGNTVAVSSVTRGTGDKEILITMEEELDVDLTYTIDLPANGIENAYFANAANKEAKGLKAQAQKDIEIKSMTAKFVQQKDNKGKADLLLTFDQRPNPESINKITVKDGSDVDEDISVTAEFYSGDTTGKTVIIKDFASNLDEVTLEDGGSYTIEINNNGVQVDAGSNAKYNQEKLKATANGVGINAPKLKKLRLNSAEEIVLEFDEDINTSNLKASNVKVLGYELLANGNFAGTTLQGDSQLKLSTSGKNLTIKPANKDVKFVTTTEVSGNVVEIEADTITNKSSKVENAVIKSNDLKAKDMIDRAKPIMIGAEKNDAETITITYSEYVEFKGNDEAKAAAQFDVKNASKVAYGKEASADSHEVVIKFNEKDTFKSDLDLAKVEVKYTKNINVLVKDKVGNEADSQTIKGLKGGSEAGAPNHTVQTAKLKAAIKDAKKFAETMVDTTAKNKLEAAISEAEANLTDKNQSEVNEAVTTLNKALEDAKKAEAEAEAKTKAEEALQTAFTEAKDYQYNPAYVYKGTVTVDNDSTTVKYKESVSGQEAINDLARYLGALYRSEGSTVSAIEYNGKTYTWDKDGKLKGSNWKSGDLTLVKAIDQQGKNQEVISKLEAIDTEYKIQLTLVDSKGHEKTVTYTIAK